MRSAWRGYHLWRQFYAPNQPILWRATLLPSATPKSTGRILPRAISEMSLRGSRGVANIRRFGARFGNLSPSLPHFPSIFRHTFHGRFETRFATDFVLRFFQRFRSISQALTNPNFSPINWISRPFSEPVERALVIQ